MEAIGHFIWIVFTMPLYGILTALWIFLKLIFFSIIGLFAIIKGNPSLEDLFFLPINVIAKSLENYDSIYKYFSNFYYEHTFLSFLVVVILFSMYFGGARR